MATKKKADARDALDSGVSSNESGELNAITVKTSGGSFWCPF